MVHCNLAKPRVFIKFLTYKDVEWDGHGYGYFKGCYSFPMLVKEEDVPKDSNKGRHVFIQMGKFHDIDWEWVMNIPPHCCEECGE